MGVVRTVCSSRRPVPSQCRYDRRANDWLTAGKFAEKAFLAVAAIGVELNRRLAGCRRNHVA